MTTMRDVAGGEPVDTVDAMKADPAPTGASFLTTPVEPMLAKLVAELPEAGGFLFEPKWDGFRAIVFRPSRGEVTIQSRERKPLDRYFPELHAALVLRLPEGSVVDGEVVIATAAGLDFDALSQRLHPAASRIDRLARETPASFVAFDLLAEAGQPIVGHTQLERRARLESLLARATPPVHLTPATRDLATARRWLADFEGAGLDGVIAKPVDAPYQPGARAMLKIKHVRTADCVVLGLRRHRSADAAVGSLLLGLHDDAGVLQQVGVTSSFTLVQRRALLQELAPLFDGEPRAGEQSRWSTGKDTTWQPLRPERVCEVRYDHLQGGERFRHATTFVRWRPDKPARDCRFDQLEVVAPYELRRIFAG